MNIEKTFRYRAIAITGKLGTTVVIDGSHPRTDGKVIYLPDGGECALGFLVHESGHVKFTDFDVWTEAIKQAKNPSTFKHVMNSLEDGFIEKAIINTFPAFKQDLDNVIEIIAKKDWFGTLEQTNPINIFFGKILLDVRFKNQGYTVLSELSEYYDGKFIEIFGQDIFDKVSEVTFEGRFIDSTEKSAELTQKIFEILNDKLDEKDEKDDSDNEESDSDPQEDSQDEKVHEIIKSILDAGEDELPDSIEDALKDLANKEAEEKAKKKNGSESRLIGKRLIRNGDYSVGNNLKQSTTKVSAELVRHLKRMFEAKSLSHRRYKSSGGDLSLSRIVSGIASGWKEDKFFQKNERPEQKLNTAIHFLIDASSSMMEEDRKIDLAKEALMAFMMAVSGFEEISVGASVFPYDYNENGEGFTGILLKHGEKLNKVIPRFDFPVCGGTPLGSSISNAVFDLLETKHKKKIIFVLTDGEPGDSYILKKALSEIEEDGRVTVYAIGIKSNSVKAYFKNNQVIHNLNDLIPAIIEFAKKQIFNM